MATLIEVTNPTDKVEIQGYEGLYSVTPDGRVWSHPKNTNNKNGKWLSMDNSRNYPMVGLMKDGKKKRFALHRLVAEAFCEKPEGCDQVNHINGDKKDNRAENLEWVTASENRLHAWREGLQTATEAHKESARKAGRSRRFLTEDQVRQIRQLAEMTFSHRHIGELFNVSKAVVQLVVSRKTYAEVI